MPFSNKDVLDLLKSTGLKETAQHFFESLECINPCYSSVRAKISALDKRHRKLFEKARRATASTHVKEELAAFLAEDFAFPLVNYDRRITNAT